jgi:heat shock protein HslJ
MSQTQRPEFTPSWLRATEARRSRHGGPALAALGVGAALLGALALAGCGSPGPGRSALAELAGAEWTLVAIDGEALPTGAKAPTATFADGRIAGFGGCNRYSGPVAEKAPGTIAIGPVAGTMMACPDGVEVEPAFLGRLGMVTRYGLESGRLRLWGADDDATQGLLFERH